MARSSEAVAALWGAVGFIATDVLVTALHWPLPWYEPLSGTVSVARAGEGAMMGLYGLLLWCLAVGGAAWALARWVGSRWDEAATARWAPRATVAWALVTVLALALHASLLIGRVPVPLSR